MHNRYTWAAAFALVVILAGCKQAPPPPAPDTHDADVKAIRDLESAQLQGFAARDLDKVCAYYADDASGFWPDVPVLKGVAAIRASYKTLLADKNYSVSFSPDKDFVDVAKSGDLGYSQGAYTMTMTDSKTKKVLTVKGKYVEVFKKQADGGWKDVADIINEDARPSPAKKHPSPARKHPSPAKKHRR
jgi:ketosteroid isomerase-like protein